jgi:type IV pilus assembly protein PilC
MQKFIYKAKTIGGKTVSGIVEANAEQEAIRLLHERGLTIFFLQEKSKTNLLPFLENLKGVSSKEIVELTRQLATMIGAGLTLTNSLSILKEQAKPGLARVLSGIVAKIEGGSSFYKALSNYPKIFSKVYLSLVKSGEAAGKLEQILAELADSLEKQEAFKRKIKGALVYPVIVVTGMIVVAFIMMVYVIPKLTEMYREFEAQLPLPTQILIFISRLVSSFWYLIILGAGLLVYGLHSWRKTALGRESMDRFFLKIPLIGELVVKVVLTQMSRTLAMLINAGVPIIEALGIVAEAAGNVIFEKSIRKAAEEVEKGRPLSGALEKFEEYPPVVIQMIAVGEQTGKVGEILVRVAEYFEQEAETAIKGLTTAIEPLMMILLGVGVGFIVISIITPIYNLTSQF